MKPTSCIDLRIVGPKHSCRELLWFHIQGTGIRRQKLRLDAVTTLSCTSQMKSRVSNEKGM